METLRNLELPFISWIQIDIYFLASTNYELQTIIDNVYLLTPELLSEVGQLVVESGHAVARKKPGEPLRGRCDSFVVETDVHYPTDVNLLWDAMRCLLRELGRAARKHNIGGWRQWRHLTQEVKKCFKGGSRNWFRWLMGLWSRGQQTNVNGELRIG